MRLVLVDAHAHLRRCFNAVTFLKEALTNFVQAAPGSDQECSATGVLCLVDASQEKGFERLSRLAKRSGEELGGKFHPRETEEEASLDFRVGGNRRLIVVAGRQVQSQENLELLTVGTRHRFESGVHADRLIHTTADIGGIPIVPWGVGKWMGKRGKVVKQLLQDPSLPQFFLGDSAHRPTFWPKPSLFRRGRKHDIWNLPGTDPFPLPKEVDRVGSYGLMLKGKLDTKRPVQDLKRKLTGATMPIDLFGSRMAPFRFVRNQALMRYRTWMHS